MRRTIVLVCSIVFLIAATALPVAAAPSARHVKITSTMFITPPANTGTFIATGPVLCEQGTVLDLGISFAYRSGDIQLIDVPKLFSCSDGSGTFTVDLSVLQDQSLGQEVFVWKVTAGSGRYQSLQGGGTGTTDMAHFNAGSVTNYYTGVIGG